MSRSYENRNYSKKFYKNSRSETGSSGGKHNPNSRNKSESETFSSKQPTILIKPREKQSSDDVAEPAKKTIMQNEAHTSQSTLPIAPAPPPATESSTTSHTLKVMTKSVKFLEDGSICSDFLQDFLGDNNDFLVVGITGGQGCGKSTILNLLAQPVLTEIIKQRIFKGAVINKAKSEDDLNLTEQLHIADKKVRRRPNLFKMENLDDVEANRNCTAGIDLYITENRVVFLDCQPLLSVTLLDELMKSEAKRSSIVTDFLCTENSGEIQSLQFMALLMSICHVMMFVQDTFYDTNMIRFLKTAEMLKPTIANPEEDFPEHFPHLILVHNKAEMEYFQPSKFRMVQQMYRLMLNDTRLHIESGLGIGNGTVLVNLCKETCGEPINLFLLPTYDNPDKYYNGHPPLEEIVKAFRSSLLGATKYAVTHVQLTERNWLAYSVKVWDLIKKSSFFVDYSKLMT